MGREYTEAQKKASLNYQSKRKQLKVTISEEQMERYKQHAINKGTSMTQLIVELLEKDIGDAN